MWLQEGVVGKMGGPGVPGPGIGKKNGGNGSPGAD